MHCSCDDRFRSCLKMVDSQASAIVGNFFFNVGNTRCFVFKMEEVSKLGLLLFTFIFKCIYMLTLGMREAKLVGCLSKDGSTSQSCLEATCCLLENSLATDSRKSLEEDSYFATLANLAQEISFTSTCLSIIEEKIKTLLQVKTLLFVQWVYSKLPSILKYTSLKPSYRLRRWSFFPNDGMVILFFQGTIATDGFPMVLSPSDHHH